MKLSSSMVKIKTRAAKLALLVAEKPFWPALLLLFLAILFSIIIFYQYAAPSPPASLTPPKSLQFREKEYLKILKQQEWQQKEQETARTGEPSNPFR